MSAAATAIPQSIPVGTIKTFGPLGEPYQVVSYPTADLVTVRLIKTGEYIDYRYDRMLADPDAI